MVTFKVWRWKDFITYLFQKSLFNLLFLFTFSSRINFQIISLKVINHLRSIYCLCFFQLLRTVWHCYHYFLEIISWYHSYHYVYFSTQQISWQFLYFFHLFCLSILHQELFFLLSLDVHNLNLLLWGCR